MDMEDHPSLTSSPSGSAEAGDQSISADASTILPGEPERIITEESSTEKPEKGDAPKDTEEKVNCILQGIERIEKQLNQQWNCMYGEKNTAFIPPHLSTREVTGDSGGLQQCALTKTREIFDRLLVRLVDNLDVAEYFLSHFVSRMLISHEMKEEILAKATSSARVSCFVGKIRGRGPDALDCFKWALKETAQTHLLKEIDECQQSDEQRHDKVTGLQKEVDELKNTKKIFTRQISQMRDEIKDSEDKLNNLQSHVERLLQESEVQDSKMKERLKELEDLQDEDSDASLDDTRESRIRELENEIEGLRFEKSKLDEEMQRLQKEEIVEKERRRSMEAQIKEKTEKIVHMDEQLITKQNKIDELQQELSEKNSVINLLMAEVQKTKQDKSTMFEVVAELQKTISDLQFLKNTKDLVLKDTEARFLMVSDKLLQVVTEKEKVTHQLHDVLEERDSQNLKLKDLEERLSDMKERQAKATCMQDELSLKLSDLQEAKSKSDVILKEYSAKVQGHEETICKYKEVLLAKMQHIHDLELKFGQRQEQCSREKSELNSQLQQKNKEIAAQEFLVSELEDINTSQNNENDNMKEEMTTNIKTLQKQNEERKSLICAKEKEAEILLAEIDNAKQDKIHAENVAEELRAALQAKSEDLKKAHEVKDTIGKVLEYNSAVNTQLQEEINLLKAKVAKLETVRVDNGSHLETKSNEIEQLKKCLHDVDVNSNKKVSTLKKEIEENGKAIAAKEFMAAEMELICDKKEEEKITLEADFKKEICKKNNEIEHLQTEVHHFREELEHIKEAMQFVYARCYPGAPRVLSYQSPFNKVTITWPVPEIIIDHVHHYEVHLTDIDGNNYIYQVPVEDSESYTMGNLQPLASYDCSVLAVLKWYDVKSGKGPTVTIHSCPPLPPAEPQQLQQQTTHDCIAFECNSADTAHVLRGYGMQVSREDGKIWKVDKALINQDNIYYVDGLKPGRTYQVEVCGIYDNGVISEYSPRAFCHTRPTSPPGKPVCKTDKKTIEWMPPQSIGHGVNIVSYVIRRDTADGRRSNEVKVPGEKKSYTYDRRLPNAQFSVKAVTDSTGSAFQKMSRASEMYFHVD